MYDNPRLLLADGAAAPGATTFQAPSNIALVKYWGKHGRQLPRNPNASFTLTVARTVTTLEWVPRAGGTTDAVRVELFYKDQLRPAFAERVAGYFTSLLPIYPFLGQFDWTVRTRNTFPHGAGIASSASAMAALAMCLVEFERAHFGEGFGESLTAHERQRKASYLARLGSGSAARSVFAKAAAWGESPDLPGSSDEYAVGLGERLHPTFHDYRDSILLVSEAEKSVSSTAGHSLMDRQPYAAVRYEQATRRFARLLDILGRGELDDFCTLVEADALDLHALMMQSHPPYLLMEPATVAVVKAVQGFRQNTGLPVCFTLDAGPNVHLLYPEAITAEVEAWLEAEVMHLLPGGRIDDYVGEGAVARTSGSR